MLRRCREPLDDDAELFRVVTTPGSSAAITPYLEARTQLPSVFHHGNRGVTRDRIREDAELFRAVRAELDHPHNQGPEPYRGGCSRSDKRDRPAPLHRGLEEGAGVVLCHRDGVAAGAGVFERHGGEGVEAGVLISGAAGRTGGIEVHNSGTLEGTDTAAIDFALSMAGSLVKLSGGSTVIGSVLMTDNDDVVKIEALTSGVLLSNITDSMIAVFDGRGGNDTVHLGAYTLADILSFAVSGNAAVLSLATAAGSVTGTFVNFEFWKVGGTTYTTAELAALAPIPVPAGLPLLGAGLGALWVLRRRRAV
jgi:hypothetical protein